MNLLYMDAKVQEAECASSFHRWRFPDGTDCALFYRTAGCGYLIRFPDLADFLISAQGENVRCVPALNVPRDTTEHLYLNQILPLVQSLKGGLVFHASAVDLPGGAIAFFGASGKGKSTLAAAFAVAGSFFLSDDGLLIDNANGMYVAMPSHASIRLWKDSEEHLMSTEAPSALPVSYNVKKRFLATLELRHCDQPRPLRAAYFLGDGASASVQISQRRPSEAVIDWVKHSFLIDVEDKVLLKSQLDRLADVVGSIPSFSLDYPRDYDYLPEVKDRIAHHVQGLNKDGVQCDHKIV